MTAEPAGRDGRRGTGGRLLALAAYPAGAFLAGVRSSTALSPPAARWAYLLLTARMAAGFALGLVRARPIGHVEPEVAA